MRLRSADLLPVVPGRLDAVGVDAAGAAGGYGAVPAVGAVLAAAGGAGKDDGEGLGVDAPPDVPGLLVPAHVLGLGQGPRVVVEGGGEEGRAGGGVVVAHEDEVVPRLEVAAVGVGGADLGTGLVERVAAVEDAMFVGLGRLGGQGRGEGEEDSGGLHC